MTPTSILEPTWTMEELYDILMYEIEPELMLTSVAFVKMRYEEETPEENEQRMERYAKAMEEFERRVDKFLFAYKKQLIATRDSVLSSIKKKTLTEEKADIDRLEQSFDA